MKKDLSTTDVIILGGGLAGLTCALQLKQRLPSLSITVIERRPLPYPEATHKVGESTVELAAHYFSEILGLKDHLKTQQLRKLGIRLFFSSKDNQEIEKRSEMGSNRYFHVPTYQIDRGRFENHVISRLENLGVQVLSCARVTDIKISETNALHSITYNRANSTFAVSCRWVLDASGRCALLKKKLDLAQPSEHDSNAVWFRIPGKVNIDEWCNTSEWLEGHHEAKFSRWLSTNHLTGNGYWVWLIPLSSDYTSIGIVTDPKIHPLSHFRTYEDTLTWLDTYEPQCAQVLRNSSKVPADYLAVKHYSHKCSRVLSPNRWAITGDAGVFLDPLYSPGSDFIGIQNTFITDCIARDISGERFIGRCEVYNNLYMQLTDSVLKTFLDQYPLFGNPRVMPLKVVWDYAVYWGFLAFLVLQDRLCDIATLKAVEDSVSKIYQLNEKMQVLLRAQNEIDTDPVEPGLLDIADIPFLMDFNKRLLDKHSPESFIAQLHANIKSVGDVFNKLKEIMLEHHSTWSTNRELVALLQEVPAPESLAA
jgi:flavin-dependent dehydrogenase